MWQRLNIGQRECHMVGIMGIANLSMACVGGRHDNMPKVKPHWAYLPEIFPEVSPTKVQTNKKWMAAVNPLLHNHLNPKEDLKEVQSPKDVARESEGTGEWDVVQANHISSSYTFYRES